MNDTAHTPHITESSGGGHGGRLPAMMLAALGIVYGDIGTSPLYTLRECFSGSAGLPMTTGSILGVLSLILWALVLVVTVKYVVFIMRADNRGEGGILALMALALRAGTADGRTPRRRRVILALGMTGAALFYGDGMITPAISVLSALEGLEVAEPGFAPLVVPAAMAILIGLFMVQSKGTERVGRLFGPVMMLWFVVLAVMGVAEILHNPGVLRAASPTYAIALTVEAPWLTFVVLGAVVLAVTGGEALYADMGHLGRRPIRIAWGAVVLPALVLNYFGQGALLLRDPEALVNPFYHLAPSWGTVPLLILATAATIIASQAVISGAFSLSRQAVQLGLIPRLEIHHTSTAEIGQIYVPRINWLLLAAVLALVAGFRSSSNLAAAYGIAVTGTMVTTTLLAAWVVRRQWQWPAAAAVAVIVPFLVIDVLFFAANTLKIAEGGWFPLVVGAGVFVVMMTWMQGRKILYDRLYADALPTDLFLERLRPESPMRVAGSAIFLTGNPAVVPHALLHNMKHNKVLHERVLLLHVALAEVPFVLPDRRVAVEKLGKGFFRVVLRFGFMERPDVPMGLERCRPHGLHIDLMESSFFLGRETLIPSAHAGLPRWQEPLFITLSKSMQPATGFFNLPPGRVVELGTQIEI